MYYTYICVISLFIKGSEDTHVIICSNSNTFELKEAETSNSLLLMPSLTHGKLIENTGSRTLMKQEVTSPQKFGFNNLEVFLCVFRLLVSTTLIMK